MGLDVVELVLVVEERFGVRLPGRDLERMGTVGDLHRSVLGQLSRGLRIGCRTSRAFLRLRRALTADLGVPRGRVRPAAPVADWFPAASRRERWAALAAGAGGLALPRLRVPGAVAARLWMLFAVVPAVAAAFTLAAGGSVRAAALGWAIAAGAVGAVLLRAADAARAVLPPGCGTVRGLTVQVAGLNYAALSDSGAGHDPREVWAALCGIVSEQLAVPVESIHPDSRWAEDLGAD